MTFAAKDEDDPGREDEEAIASAEDVASNLAMGPRC